MPSAGTRAPGRSSTRSPFCSRSTGTSSIPSPTIRIAVSGRSLARAHGTMSLRDRAHLDPMTEEHDRHERGEFLPERHAGISERHHGAEDERYGDRQSDEGHHPWQAILELAHRALGEYPAAVDEHGDAKHNRDPCRAWEMRCHEAERAWQHVTPDQRRHRQRQRHPELGAEHLDAVAGMLVVSTIRGNRACHSMPRVHLVAVMLVVSCYLAGLRRDLVRSMLRMVHADLRI